MENKNYHDNYESNNYESNNYESNPYGENPNGQNKSVREQLNETTGYDGQYNSGQDANTKGGDALAIASMVLGIISLLLVCCAFFVSFFAGIIGLILGILSIRNRRSGKGLAITGIITSAISILLSIAIGVFAVSVMTVKTETGAEYFESLYDENYNDDNNDSSHDDPEENPEEPDGQELSL